MLRCGENLFPCATSRRTRVAAIPHRLVSKRLRLVQCPIANRKKSCRVFTVILEANRRRIHCGAASETEQSIP